ncbi:CAP domain-containing protein [uncultured Psychroserpens sp.]|uniref:CAP domain-containing protein n=1 Tax=uncultured Psychroserpens sp. TaxID=255436 RepID=UPI0026018BE4|nr:CAP domain-containing protein [uncultured Psychroserpens sp.]
MKFKFFLFIILAISFQKLDAQISIADEEKLAIFLLEHINKLRIEKGKQALKRHEDLAKAAKIHSTYISKRNKLTHIQIKTALPQPKDRVEKFNTSFANIGENILYSKTIKTPLSSTGLKRLAFDMFRSWKNSPGHYANLISDSFTYGDFGFTYNAKSKRVFAVQVFGKKGHVIDGQLSKNAFGIQPRDVSCHYLIGNKGNIVVNMGNAISIVDDEVILSHHNLETMHEIFESVKDGLAIDLVARDQLQCGEENRLDVSNIYEGTLLEPKYRDDIFGSNTAQNPKRLIVSLGKIPEHLKNKDLSPNLILIKDGKKCSYAVPSNIPSRRYDLRPVDPEILIPDETLKTEGVHGIYEVSFDFKTGKTIPIINPEIQLEGRKVHSIDIKSFTSVDGNSATNNVLHSKRASYIRDFLNKNLELSEIPITINAKENWDLCFYHLELLGLDRTLGRNKEAIRAYILNNLDDKWEESLSLQRQSKAIIYTIGSWSEADNLHLNNNLTNALLNKNYDLANQALAEMYFSGKDDLFLNEEFIRDKLFDKPELVQNVAALLLKNISYYATDNIVFFVRNWLSKPDLLSEEAQKNLLNLYTITSRELLRKWDSSVEDFSKVLHPEKVEPLFENYKNKDKVSPLFLNFHMSSIEYFGQINFSPKINESFEFITNYFKSAAKSVKDDTDLSLFFNSWSMYTMTVDRLMERFDIGKMDENSAFVLAKTFVAKTKDYDPEILLNIHKLSISFNKDRWCKWINKDFQNLRDDGVKNLFCKTCNN